MSKNKQMTPREMLAARMKAEGFEPPVIEGAGGGKGGGGGRAAREATNTLQSSSIVRVLELLSEGEIEGVVGGRKGVYFNNTPVQNDDGTFNFGDTIGYDERFGLPSQPYMAGFPSAESEVALGGGNGLTVKMGQPGTTQVNSAADAIRVTVLLPSGLSMQDTKTGDLNGHTVTLAIDVATGTSGAWTQVGGDFTITGKTTSAYEKQYYVDRPASSGPWQVRVRRLSPDDANSAARSATVFSRITEIKNVKLEYADCAYVGIAVDAAAVGSAIPSRAYRVRGIKVKVPSNYDPITRVYDGAWDGSFSVKWSDNPAWVLYDLITNTRYGLGEFIDEDMVDKFSFYDAARYNDELVPDGKGGQEPRFTFNTPINSRNDAITILQNVAGAMRSTLVYSGGLLMVNQDRPSAPVKLVNNSNVINGTFIRSSTALSDRHTVVNMTWNDKTDNYLPKVSTIEDANGIARYGYNTIETAAYGATTEGQAIRNAKWILDTELNQAKLIKYQSSIAQFDLKVGDVIKVSDQNYTTQNAAGRLKSATATSVTLDRPVTILAGAKIDITVPAASGPQFVTKNITNTPGTYTTLNFSEPFATMPPAKADFIVTSALAPELYRVRNISQSASNIVDVEALFYDANKYNRIELGIDIPGDVYTPTDPNLIGKPKNLQVQPTSKVTGESVTRGLVLTWDLPDNGVPLSYNVKWRYNNGNYKSTTGVGQRSFEVDGVDSGVYDFIVYSVGVGGVISGGATVSYTLDLSGGAGSALAPVVNLATAGTQNGTTFDGQDLNVQWQNPFANTNMPVPLKDFVVQVIDNNTNNIVRTEYVDPVAAGSIAKFAYTFAMNNSDGGPRRTVKITVLARDTDNKTSLPTTVSFTNPAPAVVNNFVAFGMIKGMQLTYDKPAEPDYRGVLIWQGTTSNFTLSQASLVFDGDANLISLNNLADAQTYYYRIAAYDTFGKSVTGNGLNVSGAVSGVAAAIPGTPSGPTLPTTGQKDGDFFYNTTDKHLYVWDAAQSKWVMQGNRRGTKAEMDAYPTAGLGVGEQWFNTTDNRMYTWNGTKWVAAGIASGASYPANPAVGDTFFNTTDNKLYTWNGTKWVTPGIVSSATPPASAATGDQYYNTNDKMMYAWNGTAWVVQGVRTGTTAQRNAVTGMVTGDLFWDTDVGSLFRYNGSAWLSQKVPAVDLTGTIAAVQIANGAIDASKTNIAAIDSATGGLKAGTVSATQIVNNAISALQLANNAVTEVAIANNAVTAAKAKLAALDQSTGALVANSVTALNIVGGAITGDKINAGTITGDKIYSGTIEANKITGLQLAADTIGAREIAAGAITAVEIAARTITAENIKAGVITADEILTGSITGDKIKAGSITANELAVGAITADKITSGTLGVGVVYAGEISAAKITSGTLGAGVIYAGEISASKITSGTLGAGVIYAGEISATKITSGTFSGDRITANSMNADRLSTGTIDAGKITVSNLNASNITTGFLSASRIGANTITADKLNVTSLSALTSSVGQMTIDTSGGNGALKTSGKGNAYDGVDGFFVHKDPGQVLFEVKAGNTFLTLTNTVNGSKMRFSDNSGKQVFYVDSFGNMEINKLNVINTLSIANNAVTIPISVPRTDWVHSGMIISAPITMPQAGNIVVIYTCSQSWPNGTKGGWNQELYITGPGVYERLATTGGGSPSDSISMSGSIRVSAGTYTIQVNRSYYGDYSIAKDRSLTILGAMK